MYTEYRELDVTRPIWDLGALKVGEEYVLRSLGESWSWWTDDAIDQVMTYAGERCSLGLGKTAAIDFASAGEHNVKLVE